MEKLTLKIVVIMLIVFLSLALIPTNVFAASKEVQVVKAENGDYIVYVKDLMSSAGFNYVISDTSGLSESDVNLLSHINSVPDDSGNNQVVLIQKSSVEGKTQVYLYIDDTETTIDLTNAFDVAKMEDVEATTNKIQTITKTDIVQRDEVVDGVKYTEKVGGLEISEENKENNTYEYVSVKLPDTNYSELQDLANELNEDYDSKNMYEKIEFAKNFYDKYKALVDAAAWEPVENYLIKQPNDALTGDRYVVLLKRTAQDGTVTYDVKLMESYREDNEARIPASTDTKTINETAKLPITGENLILFAVLAVIILAAVIVFIKMKKEQTQGKH